MNTHRQIAPGVMANVSPDAKPETLSALTDAALLAKHSRNIGYKHPRYIWGTTAIHKLGDISRPDGDLCTIHARAGDNYIGNWVTGFGFIEVEFPVKTTRFLTPAEKKKWNGKRVGINGSWSYKVKLR